MKTLRPQKRSVSPFGDSATAVAVDPFVELRDVLPKSFPDAAHIPALIQKISDAPANDAPGLDGLCQFLLQFRESLEKSGAAPLVWETMQQLFERKTELFMIDHHDREHCEKMGWAAEYKDVVLFSKERDALVGRYFAPVTETQPGLFSEFVNRWIQTENPDRILHFIDFCVGSKNPTFEHYLLFTHPALARVVKNKSLMVSLFEKTQPLRAKLFSPTWERDVRAALSFV